MTVDLWMPYMLMLIPMTLTLMQDHSGLARALITPYQIIDVLIAELRPAGLNSHFHPNENSLLGRKASCTEKPTSHAGSADCSARSLAGGHLIFVTGNGICPFFLREEATDWAV